MQGSSPGLREAKKAATRRRLNAAARALALRDGLDAVTVERVCAEAEVSVRTFFNYFESKEHAVLGDPPPLGTPEARAAFLAGGPGGDLLADVIALLDPAAVLAGEDREALAQVMLLSQREPRLLALQIFRLNAHQDELAALVAERRGLPAPETSCHAVAAVAFALVHRACRDWFDASRTSGADAVPPSLQDVLDATREAFLGALAPAPTRS
ncbi:TetR/AcrR family transcriptional regulator [Kineococcus glutinatus]|uniref:TetR family transcriptional regulator n=1 Tax=Kineococcus glutinatus TaxID=1070872 RepID=A0ABP9HWK4_9ACTN